MNESTDRLLFDWLSEGPDRGPSDGLQRALAATRRTDQRPGWRVGERWIPMQLALRPAIVPRPVLLLAVAALLGVALFGALVFVGSRPPPVPPFGLAGNGSILLDVDGALWTATEDGSNPRRLDIGLGRAYSPTYSPDGTKVAFLSQAGERSPFSVFVANADGSRPSNVSGDMKVLTAPLNGLAWSPDGSQLAFTSSDDGVNRTYMVGADGTGLRAVTGRDHDRTYPGWSPDGKWLAYQLRASDSSGKTHLAISRPDGTGERILNSVSSFDASFVAPQWALDSQHLAYFRSEHGSHVVGVVDLDGHETQVSGPGEDAFIEGWSPDGSLLAYATESDGTVVVDLDDPSSRRRIPRGLAECAFTWAPDSTALLGLGDDCTALYLIPLADPAAAHRIAVPTGPITFAAWQRTAP